MPSPKTVREVMTKNPLCLPETATLAQAASLMRDSHIGVVLVNDSGERLTGLLTDRDIIVRAIADGQDPNQVSVGRISSAPRHSLPPDASIDQAVQLMSRAAIRRIPVVEDGHAVGIVSLGDLAIARNPDSVLGQISSAPSND